MVPQINVYGHTHGPFQQTCNCPRMLTAEAHTHSILRQLKMDWEGCKQKQECFYVWRHGFGPLRLHLTLELLGPFCGGHSECSNMSIWTLETPYIPAIDWKQSMIKQFTSIMRSFAFRTSWFALSVINSDVVSPVKATSGNLTVSVIYIPSPELILVQIPSYRARGRWKTWV
jgi:hypothetical protein